MSFLTPIALSRRLCMATLLLTAAAWIGPVHAQEVVLLAGVPATAPGGETSYGYA